MDGKVWDKGRNSPVALQHASFAEHVEASLMDRPQTEEGEFAISAITNGQDREEEHPTSGQVEASMQKRVLGGFFH
jgi:hypothetical protein